MAVTLEKKREKVNSKRNETKRVLSLSLIFSLTFSLEKEKAAADIIDDDFSERLCKNFKLKQI